MNMSVLCMYVYHVCTLDLLELELGTVVSHHEGVKPCSSKQAASALSC